MLFVIPFLRIGRRTRLAAGLGLGALWACVSCAGGQIFVPQPGHPRLFFTAKALTSLAERLNTEPDSAAGLKAIVERANTAVRRGRPDLAVEEIALAYRVTGDRRYEAALRAFLLTEISRPNWGEAELLRRDPPWHAGLHTAQDCFTTALAFDCIHDALPLAERRKIAAGIVRLGIEPTLDDWILGQRRIHTLDTMGHNWWSACVSMAGVAALAVLDEEPRAPGWLARIDEGLSEWFRYGGSDLENKPASFDPRGAFFESVNYDSFALSEYLLFRLAWRNALRSPAPAEIPILGRLGGFFAQVCYPNSGPTMTLNFGDGSLHANGGRPLALLWANGYRSPTAAWYLNRNRAMNYPEGIDRTTPIGLVYLPSDATLAKAPAHPPLPVSAEYTGIGWAMLRSSWADNATLLGVRAGYDWNHDHLDAGSFILFHDGQYLLINSGNCFYGRPEYDAYYRQSWANNVVLFDGQAENPEDTYAGSKFPGSVSQLLDGGDLKYVMADATGPTVQNFIRNYRHFLWIGDVILIVDDVESYRPGQFEWLLHYGGSAVRTGLDVRVAKGSASVIVRPLYPAPFPDAGLPADFPEKMKLVERTGLADHDPDRKVTYYAFVAPKLTRRTEFVTAITLVTVQNRTALPQIEPLKGDNWIGARIRQGGTTTDVYFNLLADGRMRHRNANNAIRGWETDAYLSAFTFADGADTNDLGAARRTLIVDGSYLRKGGTVVLDSLSKVFATWTDDPNGRGAIVHGQPGAQVRLRSRLIVVDEGTTPP